MQLSAKLAAYASFVFAAVCLWFALDAFMSVPDIANPEQASGGRSFAWFWTFLAAVGVAIGWVSSRVSRERTDGQD